MKNAINKVARNSTRFFVLFTDVLMKKKKIKKCLDLT